MNNEPNIAQDDYIAGRLDGEKADKVSAMEENGTIFEVVIEPDDGRFHAYCPILRGCHTWGHTEAEAFFYIEDAVKLYLKSLIEDGEPIPGIGRVKAVTPLIRLKTKEMKEEAA
jgi:predicted RNase H-like HicB family nuclease